ncbi:MAG TPA: flagellar hook-associated protein FlgL [Gaiellaceae bacterium]|nr:flagellar hook-associated protein FlgL [Gaiellaceae bacterium]
MSERITNSMLTTTLLGDLQNVTNALSKTQSELSSGMRIQKPSDDPFGTSQALGYRADLASNAQYQTNVNDGSAWLNTTDSALGDISSLVLRARDLVVQGANSSTGPSGNNDIAAEIDQIIESLKTDGNSQYAGQYIFSGTKTSTAPYAAGADDTYSGDTGTVSRQIGAGVQVPVNVDGASVLGDGSSGLIATLRQISTDLKSNNIAALGSTDLSALDTASDNVSTIRATVGARADRLTTALSRLQSLQESSTSLLSDTEDADMAQTIVTYSQQQAVYQAALKAGAQIIQPSLMDFLST